MKNIQQLREEVRLADANAPKTSFACTIQNTEDIIKEVLAKNKDATEVTILVNKFYQQMFATAICGANYHLINLGEYLYPQYNEILVLYKITWK